MFKEGLIRLVQHLFNLFLFDLPILSMFKTSIYRIVFDIGQRSYVSYGSFLLNPHFNKGAKLQIGSDTGIENGCHLDYSGGLFIGNHVWVSEYVFIATHGHIVDGIGLKKEQPIFFSPLIIGDDSWLGANCIVLPQVKRIGVGAVVGAGSIITKDVPDYAIVAGNPARILRYRMNET
jgi:acetyltransferase-like isoleucine patch superfamily enzyme